MGNRDSSARVGGGVYVCLRVGGMVGTGELVRLVLSHTDVLSHTSDGP